MWLVTLFVLFTSAAQALEKRALSARDPAIAPLDFSWTTSWAAVGDSFTAGIGSGNVDGSQKEDRAYSRYDYSYPSILNQYFGSSMNNSTYLACSGDTSVEIAAKQARLSEGLDLAVITAGGNDLCLGTIIKTCILTSVTSESSCQKVMLTAQTILEDNIVSLLTSLDAKMDNRGMIVFASYAPYFNNQTSDCTDNQGWVFPGQAGSTSLLLSTAHRTSFNTLVANTNAKLKAATGKVAKTASSTILFADWSAWGEAVGGRFCESGSSADPDDSSNDNVMFYKLPTYKIFTPGTVYRRDSEWQYGSILELLSNTTAVLDVEKQKEEVDQLFDWLCIYPSEKARWSHNWGMRRIL